MIVCPICRTIPNRDMRFWSACGCGMLEIGHGAWARFGPDSFAMNLWTDEPRLIVQKGGRSPTVLTQGDWEDFVRDTIFEIMGELLAKEILSS